MVQAAGHTQNAAARHTTHTTHVTYTVPNISCHEYAMLSWFAAHSARAKEVEAVDEEAEHRIVWGLKRDAPAVRLAYKDHTITAVARSVDAPVAQSFETVHPVELALTLPAQVGMEDLLAHAKEMYTAHFKINSLTVYYTRKYDEDVRWNLYGRLPGRRISTVKLSGGLEQRLLDDARRFLATEDVYSRFGQPYKRVYCLHGPPGTGKTSVVTAIATELQRPLAIVNASSLRDDTFLDLMSNRPPNSILLFEDVDSLFRGRNGEDAGMSFSTMLNALDGVLHPRGALIFLTTNHLDRLDAALRRPGRVDVLMQVAHAQAEQTAALWQLAYPGTAPPATGLTMDGREVKPALLTSVLFGMVQQGLSAKDAERALPAALRDASNALSNAAAVTVTAPASTSRKLRSGSVTGAATGSRRGATQ